jgi:outer membrane protein TolC
MELPGSRGDRVGVKRGRVKRGYDVAKAQWEQAKIEYEVTTANAFGEVSRALADRTRLVETERSTRLGRA